jgi:hypothetical protein
MSQNRANDAICAKIDTSAALHTRFTLCLTHSFNSLSEAHNTFRFRLEQWREAFVVIANQGESGAVKVAIDFR